MEEHKLWSLFGYGLYLLGALALIALAITPSPLERDQAIVNATGTVLQQVADVQHDEANAIINVAQHDAAGQATEAQHFMVLQDRLGRVEAQQQQNNHNTPYYCVASGSNDNLSMHCKQGVMSNG